MEGWVGLVGCPTADTMKWSHINHRSGKVCQPKTRRPNHWATPPTTTCQSKKFCKYRHICEDKKKEENLLLLTAPWRWDASKAVAGWSRQYFHHSVPEHIVTMVTLTQLWLQLNNIRIPTVIQGFNNFGWVAYGLRTMERQTAIKQTTTHVPNVCKFVTINKSHRWSQCTSISLPMSIMNLHTTESWSISDAMTRCLYPHYLLTL